MVNKIVQKMKRTGGFTLIETVISVVILGIAIIPLSTVFTMTIDQTNATRRQLIANEIAQQYIENLKNKDFDAFNDVFDEGTVRLLDDPSEDLSSIGMESVPSNYTVRMSYNRDVDLEEFALPDIPEGTIVDYDAQLQIPSGYDSAVYLTELVSGNNTTTVYPILAYNHSIREIIITGDRDDNSLSVAYYSDGIVNSNSFSVPVTSSNIRIDLGDGIEGTLLDTRIIIDSNLIGELKLDIYETGENTVKPIIEVRGGRVSIARNLQEVSEGVYRIVEIQVDVIYDVTGEVVASVTSTKISE